MTLKADTAADSGWHERVERTSLVTPQDETADFVTNPRRLFVRAVNPAFASWLHLTYRVRDVSSIVGCCHGCGYAYATMSRYEPRDREEENGGSSPPCQGVVIFDLDGTLTRPALDFDLIRAEIGIASGPILEAVEKMDDASRGRAIEILEKHEWRAARRVSLYDHAVNIVSSCKGVGYFSALLTRNTRPIVDFLILQHGFEFDAIRTREDDAIKPSPKPVLSICDQLGVRPDHSWMVGDFLFDIVSGRQAGARTVLMIGDGPLPEFAGQADHVIRRLDELFALLQSNLDPDVIGPPD